MDSFKFHGKLYEVANEIEEPHRVITGVSETIKDINTEETIGQAFISTLGDASNNQQVISLALDKESLVGPQGPQGEVGPIPGVEQAKVTSYMYDGTTNPEVIITPSSQDETKLNYNFKLPYPNFYIGTVSSGDRAEVLLQKIDERGNSNPLYTRLNFTIPKGDTGRTPIILIDRNQGVVTLNPEEDAYVRMVTPDANNNGDVVLQFGIPRGHKGEPGEKGDPFVIQHTYSSISAMENASANNEFKIKEFAVIQANVEDEDNAKLYYKEIDGTLTYICDFSGATGPQGPQGPRGEKGEKGDPGEVAGVILHTNIINENNKYVGDININEDDPTTLNITKINIADSDLPSAISAAKISGTLSTSNIPDLPTSKITSGTFDLARIPDLPASKTTSGTFSADRIPELSATKIISDTFDVARIPDISVNKITGTLPITKGGTGATTSAAARTNLDVYSKAESNNLLNNYSTTEEMSTAIANYAYSKIETYTKTEVDTAINNKQTNVTVVDGIISIL